MAPGLLGSELADTPPHYIHKTMEENYFPPISRKSTISMGSETDPNDYVNKARDRSSITRGSVPASLSASPVKFPSIDRANSTSVASLPGSRAARQRTHTREMRATYCRSPSCPSHLDISRDFTKADLVLYNKSDSRAEPDTDSGNVSDQDTKPSRDSGSKLPNIFSKDCDNHLNLTPRSRYGNNTDRTRDTRATTLSLRRSESLGNALHPTGNHVHNGSHTNRDQQRQVQTTALLLPLRNEVPQVNSSRKKKKKRQRNSSQVENDGDNQQSNRYSSDGSVAHRYTYDNDSLLDAIALENDYRDEEDMATPRPIEISSPRTVKKWLNSNRSTQKEGKVKA